MLLLALVALAEHGAHVRRLAEERRRPDGGVDDVRRGLDVVRLAAVARHAVHTDFYLGRVAEMRFVEILGADVQGRKLGVRRGGTEPSSLDVFDLVVRDEVLRDAANGQRECL